MPTKAITRKRTTSISALILANSIPLFGVLFFGWSIGGILVLYWLENIVVGLFNVVRMRNTHERKPSRNGGLQMFFVVHYGFFTAIHGVFVFMLFSPADLDFASLAIGFGALFVSHYVSYRIHYIGNKEFLQATNQSLFFRPYKRIVVLHIVIIAGGGFAAVLGSPLPALVFLVVLKVALDSILHVFEHKSISNHGTNHV